MQPHRGPVPAWSASRSRPVRRPTPTCAAARRWPSRSTAAKRSTEYGDTSVSDVLKRLPGVNIQGGAPRMRGLGSGYTLVLINGDPAPPGFQFDQLNPSQIERIEVTRGPTADQSAQAVAGAINIILKDAPKVSQRDLRLGLGYNAVRPTPSASFTYGERQGGLALSLAGVGVQVAHRQQQPDPNATRLTASNGQPSSAIQNSRQDNWGLGFNTSPRVNWKISDDESASAQFFAQRGEWNSRQSYTNEALLGLPSLDADNFFQGTWQNLRSNWQWNNRFSESQRIELKLGTQVSKNTFDGLTSNQRRVRRRQPRPQPHAGRQVRPIHRRSAHAFGRLGTGMAAARREAQHHRKRRAAAGRFRRPTLQCPHLAPGAVHPGRMGDLATVGHLPWPAQRTHRDTQRRPGRAGEQRQPRHHAAVASDLQVRPQGPRHHPAPASRAATRRPSSAR